MEYTIKNVRNHMEVKYIITREQMSSKDEKQLEKTYNRDPWPSWRQPLVASAFLGLIDERLNLVTWNNYLS